MTDHLREARAWADSIQPDEFDPDEAALHALPAVAHALIAIAEGLQPPKLVVPEVFPEATMSLQPATLPDWERELLGADPIAQNRTQERQEPEKAPRATPDDPEPPEGLAVDQDVARPESAPVAGPYPPVRTAQELDTLPLWSAVRDADGDLWIKTPDGWQCISSALPDDVDPLDYAPLWLEHRAPAEDELVVRIPDEIAERIANDQGMWVPEPWLRAIGDAIKAKDARRG